MNRLALFLIPAALFGVDGTVVNRTTGQPQGNVIVSLIQPSQSGMQTLGSVKTDSNGKFTIDKSLGEGPGLLQALYAGVTYSKMLQPGAPSQGVEVEVFDSTPKLVSAELNQHMVLLQPNDTGIQVNEMYLMRNTGNVTYSDPANGTLRFYAPPGAGAIRVRVAAPGGMPVQRPAEPAGGAGMYKVIFPIKPGETRFDIEYRLETSTKEYTGKRVLKGGETRVVVPNGVTVEGAGLEKLSTEEQIKATIYRATKDNYTAKLSGTGAIEVPESARRGEGEAAAGGEAQEDNGQLQIQASKPRIYEKLPIVLALASAILLLGFLVLYRRQR